MAFVTERRLRPRYPDQGELVYTRSGTHEYANGTLVDVSLGGLGIRSRYCLEPGTGACVKMGWMPALFRVRVVWCAPDRTCGGFRMGMAREDSGEE
jgi:hypothetical protein